MRTYYVAVRDTAILVHNCGEGVVSNLTSRAARRQAMREAGIPTSQQPVGQLKTKAGYQYRYEVTRAGGRRQEMVVTDQTTDRVAGHGPRWEAGPVKPGRPKDGLGRLRVANQKAKVNYRARAVRTTVKKPVPKKVPVRRAPVRKVPRKRR